MDDLLKLTFNQHQTALAIQVSKSAELPNALKQMGLSDSRPILVIVGGAGQMSDRDFSRIQKLFLEVLAPIAESLNASVVDGGTDSGVMRLIGNARSQINAHFPLVGVAPTAKVILPDTVNTSVDDATPLEPNHTHFVLVPGNNWGDESPWIVQVATVLAHGSPSLTVLINGGEITFMDALNSIISDRLVMVIAGSGRTADKLVSALQGDTTDERATKLADSGKLQSINLDGDQKDLIHTITNLLSH